MQDLNSRVSSIKQYDEEVHINHVETGSYIYIMFELDGADPFISVLYGSKKFSEHATSLSGKTWECPVCYKHTPLTPHVEDHFCHTCGRVIPTHLSEFPLSTLDKLNYVYPNFDSFCVKELNMVPCGVLVNVHAYGQAVTQEFLFRVEATQENIDLLRHMVALEVENKLKEIPNAKQT